MSATAVRRLSGSGLLAHEGDVRRVYREAFAEPPWSEDASVADRFLDRLAGDAARPGFTAAGAFADGGALVGLATAWTTPTPFPSGRCYPQAAAALGAERTTGWLCGGREVDELAVAASARGRGMGAALLDAVTAEAPGGRCWLLTSVRAPATIAFYRRRGWTQATHPAPGGSGIAVFLGPGHPARADVPHPL
ncbi:GNAT family N-acetyltransferase [Streptomyces zhihengii]|uniref:GNAT family N-acetyltransferase n=1 Tax=Streptomyces zhihengii TaxID=1818004 RepID=UPI0033A4657E